jgi:1-acyl-sn-glycerol-3-phosphate acyltransferase
VALVVDRPVRFLALDELFGHYPVFDTVTLWLGAIPMTRTGVPLSAMRTAIAELHAGGTVGLFPEGRRVAAWGDEWPRRGAAWLSYRTGAPLIPVALKGTGDVMPLEEMKLHRHPVKGRICEPILPDAYEGVADPVGAMTQEWAKRIGEGLRS